MVSFCACPKNVSKKQPEPSMLGSPGYPHESFQQVPVLKPMHSVSVVMLFMPSVNQAQPAHDQRCLAT